MELIWWELIWWSWFGGVDLVGVDLEGRYCRGPHEEWLSDYMIALLLLQGAILCFSEASTWGDAGLIRGHWSHSTEPHQGRHQVRDIQYSLTPSHSPHILTLSPSYSPSSSHCHLHTHPHPHTVTGHWKLLQRILLSSRKASIWWKTTVHTQRYGMVLKQL